MTISDNLNRIINAKANIKQAIENKGVEVSDNALLDEYPALIESIEVGSGEGGGNSYYEEIFNQRTNNGTNFEYLFYYSTSTSLDLSKLNTNNVTNMNRTFCECHSLTTLGDVSNWDVSNVTNMEYMFSGCQSLTSIDVSNWKTSNVTTMEGMFYNSNISSIDVSNWDVSNVYSMANMFSSCDSLPALDVSSWNTSNVTNMGGMFAYMGSPYLTSLNLSNFNISKVTNMGYIFSWCTQLQELDIRNFELVHEDGSLVEMYSMLEGCNNLRKLHLDNCSNATISRIINESGIPQEIIYDTSTDIWTPIPRKIYCKEENAAGLTAPNGWEFSYVTEEEPEEPSIPLYVPGEFNNNENKAELTEVSTMVTSDHTDLSYMFYNCTNLTTINGTDNWDTSNVNNMEWMFTLCSQLASLDVNSWDTSDVTNMHWIFFGCRSLTELDLSNFNTSKVTDMESMFESCASLTTLDISNFDTSSVASINGMFFSCTSLHTIRLDNCSNDTISKIITSANFPTDAIDGVTRTIYCKEENAAGLTPPTNWVFEYIG